MGLRRKVMPLGGFHVFLVPGFLVCIGRGFPPVNRIRASVFFFGTPPSGRRVMRFPNPTLSVAVGRVAVQRPLKLCRSRRSFEIARQNLTVCRVATVKFPIGVRVGRQCPRLRARCRRTARVCANTTAFRVHLSVRLSGGVPAKRARRDSCFSAEREFVEQEVFHSAIVHDEQRNIRLGSADLKPETSTFYLHRGRGAPTRATCPAAYREPAAIFRAKGHNQTRGQKEHLHSFFVTEFSV